MIVSFRCLIQWEIYHGYAGTGTSITCYLLPIMCINPHYVYLTLLRGLNPLSLPLYVNLTPSFCLIM
jgi:hypothetical protein